MDTRREDNRGLVFGLDIGTRNVVGTVGYRDENETFNVIAQYCKEHDTRAMLDGQIHDIGKVGKTIQVVKTKLEEMTGIDFFCNLPDDVENKVEANTYTQSWTW